MKSIIEALLVGVTVAYQASGQVTAKMDSEFYTYDPSGNMVEKRVGDLCERFSYEEGALKGGDDGCVFVYDRAGRLISEVAGVGWEKEFTYGYGSRVVGVSDRGEEVELLYNAAGDLVGEVSSDGPSTYIWDGIGLVADDGVVYVNEEHRAGGIPVLDGGDVCVSDPFGSTLSVGDRDFESTAYGEGLEGGRLTGKPFIGSLGKYLFPFREYSAGLARWSSADPSGFPDGANNYQFVLSDPIGNIDPLGLDAEIIFEREGDNPSDGFSNHSFPYRPMHVKGWSNVTRVGNTLHNITWKTYGELVGWVFWDPAGTATDYGTATLNGNSITIADQVGAHEGGANSDGWTASGSGGEVGTRVTHDENGNSEVVMVTYHKVCSEAGVSGIGLHAVGVSGSLSWPTGKIASTTTGGIFKEQ